MRRSPLRSGFTLSSLAVTLTVAMLSLAGLGATATAQDTPPPDGAAVAPETPKDAKAPETPAGGGAPGAQKKPPALEVLGGEEPRTVALQASNGGLVGQVTIVVRGEKKPRPTFVRDEGTGVVVLGDDSEPASLKKIATSNGVHAIRVEFRLPGGEPVSAADGSLFLTVKEETQVVRLQGSIREFKALTVQPKELKLDDAGDSAEVTLSGADLVGFLRGSPASPATMLSDGEGGSLTAVLRLPKADEVAEENPNRAEATLELSGDPDHGKYTGTLPLSNLVPGVPAVEVELSSGSDWYWMVLAVLAGVLFVGLLTQIVAYAVRRRLLLKVLRQSKATYDHVRRKTPNETASWRLGDLVGKSLAGRREDEYRLQGLEGLEVSIEYARSTADFDEDTERALNMVARIQRWLRVEPAARRLKRVADLPHEGKIKGNEWRGTNALRDTRMLLEIAQREPASAEQADDLVWRLLRQAEWHHKFAAVWAAAVEEEALHKGLEELEQALGEKSTVGSRKAEEQDSLDQKLDAVVQRLPASQRPTAVPWSEDEEPSEECGVTRVEWGASPNLFTGWATLDGQSYGQLAGKASRGARSLGIDSLRTELRAYGGPGFAWTAAILLLTSLAYGLAKYSDTWGSNEDVLEAFLAGALGTVVVDWAALPIFQSIRLRKAAKAGEEKKEEKKAKDEGGGDEGGGGSDGRGPAAKPRKEEEAQGAAADLDAAVQIVRRSLARLGLR